MMDSFDTAAVSTWEEEAGDEPADPAKRPPGVPPSNRLALEGGTRAGLLVAAIAAGVGILHWATPHDATGANQRNDGRSRRSG